MNLTTLFNPKSIAVIGASADKNKLGYSLLVNVLANKKRKIYPINPTAKNILRLPCYPSVKVVKGAIDLALIAVPADIVSIVLKECGEKKIPNVVIITAGFKEAGDEGLKREQEIKSIAEKYKINIIGPNCLGIMNVQSKLNASFGGNLPSAGGLAFISQSGAVGTSTLDWAIKEKIGFSKFISLGNEAGLTENDFLEYLGNDKDTTAILMYLEAITDGKKFVELAKKITQKKPIVVLKAGKTERGLKAVSSHTGSLAPSDKIFEVACRQSGIISLNSLSEVFGVVKLFQSGITKPIKDLVVLTNGGGPSIVACDLIESSKHLNLMEISSVTKNKLRQVLPSTASVNNPVDIIGDALMDRYKQSLDILCADKKVGGIIVMLTPQKMTEIEETAKILKNYKNKKPITAVFIGGSAMDEAKKIFIQEKIANYTCPSKVIEALDYLHTGTDQKKRQSAKSSKIGQQKSLDFLQSRQLLKTAGINLTGIFIEKKLDLTEKLKNIKYPIAMKVVSDQVLHKSDAGGVKVNIKNLAEAVKAWDEIVKKIQQNVKKAKIDGMVVQTMASGKEVIIGMLRDKTFGPVIIFGLGGIFVEILQDSSMRLAPVSESEAKKMILEIKASPFLTGVRGQKPVNIKALAKIITAVSVLAIKNPEIQEIDLNPVMVNETSAEVVDWRIINP